MQSHFAYLILLPNCCTSHIFAIGFREQSMQERNARFGFLLFGIYLLLYGGFVLLNAFSPETMEITPVAGVNLAILYGFGLIIAGIIAGVMGIMGLLKNRESSF